MNQRLSCFAFACSSLLAAAGTPARCPAPWSGAVAQVPETIQDPGRPASPSAPAPTDPAVAERLAKWKALVFDRRPSAILQAWAAPELKPYDPAEEKPEIEPDLRELVMSEFGVDPTKVAEEASAPPEGATADAQLAQKQLQRELAMFQRDVTLSRWDEVAEFLAAFPAANQQDVYEHFLRTLLRHPQTPADQRVPPNLQEKNRFTFEETLVLAGMAPEGFDKKQVPLLAPLVQRAIEGGSVVEEFVRLLDLEVKKPADEQRVDRREAALLLSTIGQAADLGPFLPGPEAAEEQNDREALNLLARHYLALFETEKRNAHLEAAWRVTQAALAKGEVGEEEKQEALLRAVELAPKVREELGPQWLEQSFTTLPERGMEIIATIGGEAAKGFQQRAQDTDYRTKVLRLQKSAVEALLRAAPQLAEQWRPSLELLAASWIIEAAYSRQYSQSTRYGPVMQRDPYGNIFWTSQRLGGGGPVQAVEPVDLVESQPGPEWVALLDGELRPHFYTVSAQLFLKVNEPARAFPFIEQLAAVNPRKAKELADEFLRVWTRENNPNLNNSRTNPYMYMYGFESRASGIPLTRSKQERNLAELADWVERLRRLPIDGVDQKLLGEAFMAAHSAAEVYRLETLEKVFGDISALDPTLLAEALSVMRTNLATVWRVPAVQERAKTRRNEKEMLVEVARGYETALSVASEVMERQGEHWALLALTAAILHDQNNFAKEQKRDSGFAEARKAAFELFERAAADYVRRAPDLRIDQESIGAFDTWFYAALGACDLGVVDEETVLAESQLPCIRTAMQRLPDGSRERHEAMFANALFTRMSSVRPQIKYRYLRAGFEIVGDHPQAVEARNVFDYYEDLTRELRLECVVDGPSEVGTAPFGVRVDIMHSPEIERESGGFAKYAINQNNLNYAYNYGRPLENYRDRFDEAVRGALNEHFEVLSVTWNGEQMSSRATDDAAWRRTPYAYLLLKARGPEVDRIPAIQMDFDFIDTSGYAVLPIGSAPVAIDASRPAGEPRPYADLSVTQLLDERRLEEGKVTLEVKATAKGLVPALDAILELELPGFRVEKSDDQGATVNKFAEDQERVESERVWLLALAPADEGAAAGTFVFGRPLAADIAAVFQRYSDADLETVSAEVALATAPGDRVPRWFWVLLGLALTVYVVWFFTVKPGGRAGAARPAIATMPGSVTPFTVLVLLREIEAKAKLHADDKAALAADILRIERCHFGRDHDPSLDLEALARDWLTRAS